MSSSAGFSNRMDAPEGEQAQLEARLREIAAAFPYPAAPDLAARERQRLEKRRLSGRRPARLSLGLALLIIALLAALLVSPARARLLDWIRIGAVQIFFAPTATAPAPIFTATPRGTGTPAPETTPSPAVSPTYLQSLLDMAGETTLDKAREQADFPIQLPAYPADLGQPDHVYLQRFAGPVVVLVWMDPDQPGQVRLSLSMTRSKHSVFEKYDPKSVIDTQVNGLPAVWVEGDYLVVMRDGDAVFSRLVEQGHTLIWSDGALTFRLETDADIDTAIRMAESIR